MNRKEAKAELKQILDNQKTVSITRLKRILDILNYNWMEKEYTKTCYRVKRQKEELRKKDELIYELTAKRAN